MSRFCVAWNHHNWIRLDPNQVDRTCSICGTVEPRRANRGAAIPRRPGRHAPAVTMAVDSMAQANPCPKNEEGDHLFRPGRGYDFCDHCGLVLRDAAATPRRSIPGWPSMPSEKAVRRRTGKVLMLFARDGEGCFYCRSELAVGAAVLDHFIPRSAGGPDELENRRASCFACDKRKRDKMPWVFMPDRFAPPDPDAVGSPDPAIQRPLNPPELVDRVVAAR